MCQVVYESPLNQQNKVTRLTMLEDKQILNQLQPSGCDITSNSLLLHNTEWSLYMLMYVYWLFYKLNMVDKSKPGLFTISFYGREL